MPSFGYIKSEAKYVAWLRSALRRVWTKHPVKLEMLKKNRQRKMNKVTGRMVYQYQCCKCNNWHVAKNVEVNHIETVGTLTLDTLGTHAERLLLVTEDMLELVCKPCHAVITYSERSGMSIEDSELEKKLINFFKKYDAKEQKRRFGLAGLVPAKTQALRRDQLREHLRSTP